MEKLKPLLPTLRENRRYIVFEAIAAETLKEQFEKEFLKHITQKLGVFDSAGAGVMGLGFAQNSSKGIISVNSKYVDKARAAIALYNHPGIIVRVVGVSGMLNKAKQRYIKGNEKGKKSKPTKKP